MMTDDPLVGGPPTRVAKPDTTGSDQQAWDALPPPASTSDQKAWDALPGPGAAEQQRQIRQGFIAPVKAVAHGFASAPAGFLGIPAAIGALGKAPERPAAFGPEPAGLRIAGNIVNAPFRAAGAIGEALHPVTAAFQGLADTVAP